jgi:hypothetical protein
MRLLIRSLMSRCAAIVVACLVLTSGARATTTFTGTLLQVQSSASQTTPGNTRVAINTGTTTACTGAYAGWYAYDLPSASTGAMWGATLLAAIAAGKSVMIYGTGTCDAYGFEIVLAVVALP